MGKPISLERLTCFPWAFPKAEKCTKAQNWVITDKNTEHGEMVWWEIEILHKECHTQCKGWERWVGNIFWFQSTSNRYGLTTYNKCCSTEHFGRRSKLSMRTGLVTATILEWKWNRGQMSTQVGASQWKFKFQTQVSLNYIIKYSS